MTATTDPSAVAPRGKTASLLLWIAARLPAFAVGMAGLAKFYASARWDRLFVSWGYPTWCSKATGVIEIVGAILIFVPRTTVYGALVLAVTMLGAFLTLVTHRAGQFGWGATPLVYCIWLGIIAVVHRKDMV